VSPDGDDTTAVASYGLTPFRNVQTAIDFADAHRAVATNVCVAGGPDCEGAFSYAENFRLHDGINVYGSFESTAWSGCPVQTTVLAPIGASGVALGPDIQTPTTLLGFVIRPTPAESATAVTVQGSRRVVLAQLRIEDTAENFNVNGIEVSAGAELTLSVEVRIGTEAPAMAEASAAAVRVKDSRVTGGATVAIVNKGASTCAFCLENSIDSRLGLHAYMGGSSEAVGVRAVGGEGLVVSGQIDFYSDASSDNNYAYDLVDAGEVSVAGDVVVRGGTTVGLRALRTRVLSSAHIKSLGSQYAYGVVLEDALDSQLSDTRAGSSGEFVGLWLTGDNAGAELGSVEVEGDGEGTGILVDDCDGASPVISTAVRAVLHGGAATAIQAWGDCHPRIEGADITVDGTNAGRLTGIACTDKDGVFSRCSIVGNTVTLNNLRTLPGLLTATGISCADCTEISDNRVPGLATDSNSISRSTSPTSVGVSSDGSSTLIARNLIGAGCGYHATGMQAAGRIENNFISGGAGCANTYILGNDYKLDSVGLRALGGADVHSNFIDAGSAGDEVTWGCTSVGLIGGARVRNNVVLRGPCSSNAAEFGGFDTVENNYFYGTLSSLTAEEFNDLYFPRASGNFSSGTTIDAGTPTGAPADDFEGKPRNPLEPDVGPIEHGDYCPAEGCSGHGVCFQPVGGDKSCSCEAGYINDGPLSCVVDGCYQNGGCDPLVACTRLPDGGHECGACPAGYTGSGETGCADIDECALDNGGCDPLSVCSNTQGGRECGPCPPGYLGSGETGCFDQCLVENGGCDPRTSCSFGSGGLSCGPCPPGMTGSGATACSAPACDPNPCLNDGVCIGLPTGNHACDCPPGLAGSACEIKPQKVVVSDSHACSLLDDGSVRCWGVEAPSDPAGDIASGPFADLIDVGPLCGLHADGTIACWGTDRAGLVTPPAGSFARLIDLETNACGIRTDSTLACWGLANHGINEAPSGTFTDVQSYGLTACGLRTDGTLACWGSANEGATSAPAGQFASFAMGVFHGCALRTDGTLECWGSNTYGEATPPSGSFTQVVSGQSASCALRVDGVVACWGSGDDSFGTAPSGSFDELWATFVGACGRRVDGAVVCWGRNPEQNAVIEEPLEGVSLSYAGGCGLTAEQSIRCFGSYDVPPGKAYLDTKGGCRLTYAGRVECDFSTAPTDPFTALGPDCGILLDGSLLCWGNNFSGELDVPSGSFTAVSRDASNVCAIRTDGTLACWGAPGPKSTPPAGTFVQVSVGQAGPCGVRTDGTLACWAVSGPHSAPPGTFSQVSVGDNASCAVSTDGTIQCWTNTIGAWDTTPPPGTFTAVSVGTSHACALGTDHRVQCWGRNEFGVTSPPPDSFETIDAGGYTSCGVLTDRSVKCWGARTR
jgi:hypothetical protein